MEIISLSQCLPDFRHTSPGTLKKTLQESTALPLEQMPTWMARQLATDLTSRGVVVGLRDESYASFPHEDKTTGDAWLVEDNDEARAVAESMIAVGVPVVNVEAWPIVTQQQPGTGNPECPNFGSVP